MAYRRNNSEDDRFDAEDVLEQSRKMAQRLGIKDDSWFGLQLDQDTRTYIGSTWNPVMTLVKTSYGHHAENIAAKGLNYLSSKGLLTASSPVIKIPLLGKLLSNPKNLAGAFFVVLAASPVLPSLFSPVTTWRKERAHLATTCAPILKEMQADGLPNSIGSVGVEHNEIIYAHRSRLNSTLSHFSFNNFLSLASTQIAPFTKNTPAEGNPAGSNNGGLIAILSGAVEFGIGKYKKASNEKFSANQNTCSAFTLIETLNEQIKKHANQGGNIARADLAFPKTMGNRSTTLANYIATIIKAHNADMARMHPEDFSELRPALSGQLQEVSKQLASAIAAGDLAPLSLIRLIGEGHIIKQQGRGLIEPSEISALVGKHAGSALSRVDISAEDYLKMAAFKDKELRETLNNLDGVERGLFASFFPNSVLKRAGLSEDQISTIRAETAPVYERNLAVLLAGICAQNDEELKKSGMADSEIKTLREAHAHLENHGEEAVHAMRANATNAKGIELPLVNAALPLIQSGTHLGTLMQAGKEALAEHETRGQQNHAERSKRMRAGTHHEMASDEPGETKRRRHYSDHADRADNGAGYTRY